MIVVNARIEATEATISAMKDAILQMETASQAEAGADAEVDTTRCQLVE